jgi:type IV pilus assembly protein PilA
LSLKLRVVAEADHGTHDILSPLANTYPIIGEFIMRTKARRSGFTLPEVLVTVTVIAVLAAVVVPAVTQFSTRGDGAATVQDLSALRGAVTGYVTNNHNYPTNLFDVASFGSFSFGPSATSASTLTSAGYGFTISNTFGTGTINGVPYLTVTLTSPTNDTGKKCSDIDKEIDNNDGGTSGTFQYATDVAPCATATYFLTPK